MTMMQSQSTREWPATPIQGWMAAHDDANPVSGYYVLPFTWKIAGQVDWAAFTAAFEAMCTRHPILRSGLRRGAQGWIQSVLPQAQVPVSLRDGTTVTGAERDKLLQDSYHEYCRKPFSLTTEPAARVLVLALEDEFLVLGAIHQAACDIESMAIFTDELWRMYESASTGSDPALPGPELDFAAYATEMAETRSGQDTGHLEFWADRLRGLDLVCPLPVDYPQGRANPFGPTAYFKIGGRATAIAAHDIARQERCSQHSVLMAAFTLALSRRTGLSSFVLSCPASTRRAAALLGVFGPLTDMMWLRVDVTGTGVRENARLAFRDILAALSHPCAIDVLAERLAAGPAGPAAAPNIQCQFFSPERVSNPSWISSSVKVKDVMPVQLLTGPLESPFWLDLTIAGERDQSMTDYSLTYRCDLFRAETAQALAQDIDAIICAQPITD